MIYSSAYLVSEIRLDLILWVGDESCDFNSSQIPIPLPSVIPILGNNYIDSLPLNNNGNISILPWNLIFQYKELYPWFSHTCSFPVSFLLFLYIPPSFFKSMSDGPLIFHPSLRCSVLCANYGTGLFHCKLDSHQSLIQLIATINLQLLTVITTIDDLNYPEKTDTYFIVNAPYIFSACWKVCLLSYSFHE